MSDFEQRMDIESRRRERLEAALAAAQQRLQEPERLRQQLTGVAARLGATRAEVEALLHPPSGPPVPAQQRGFWHWFFGDFFWLLGWLRRLLAHLFPWLRPPEVPLVRRPLHELWEQRRAAVRADVTFLSAATQRTNDQSAATKTALDLLDGGLREARTVHWFGRAGSRRRPFCERLRRAWKKKQLRLFFEMTAEVEGQQVVRSETLDQMLGRPAPSTEPLQQHRATVEACEQELEKMRRELTAR